MLLGDYLGFVLPRRLGLMWNMDSDGIWVLHPRFSSGLDVLCTLGIPLTTTTPPPPRPKSLDPTPNAYLCRRIGEPILFRWGGRRGAVADSGRTAP